MLSRVDSVTSTAGIVAIAAGAVAVVALGTSIGLASRCGGCGPPSGRCSATASIDLVGHAASLQASFAGADRVRPGRQQAGSISG